MRTTFPVQITAHPEKPHCYIACYRSAFLGATYSVEFENTLTGSVALFHFVEMLQTRYPGCQVSFKLPANAEHHPVPAVRDAFSMQGT